MEKGEAFVAYTFLATAIFYAILLVLSAFKSSVFPLHALGMALLGVFVYLDFTRKSPWRVWFVEAAGAVYVASLAFCEASLVGLSMWEVGYYGQLVAINALIGALVACMGYVFFKRKELAGEKRAKKAKG